MKYEINNFYRDASRTVKSFTDAKRKLLTALLLVTSGCAGETVNVSGLPADVQAEVAEAVAEWDLAAPVDLRIEYSGAPTVHIRRLGTPEHPFVPSDDWRLAGWTQTSSSRVDIYLDPRLWEDYPPELRKFAILHELGHLLGLVHAEHGIMTPCVHPQVCIDAETAAKLGGKGTCE